MHEEMYKEGLRGGGVKKLTSKKSNGEQHQVIQTRHRKQNLQHFRPHIREK